MINSILNTLCYPLYMENLPQVWDSQQFYGSGKCLEKFLFVCLFSDSKKTESLMTKSSEDEVVDRFTDPNNKKICVSQVNLY